MFYRCALRALKHFGVEKDYTQTNLDDIYALAQGRNGRKADLPQGICAVREYGKIAVFRAKPSGFGEEYVFSEGEFAFGDVHSRPGLGKRERELVILSSLATQGYAQEELRSHINMALNVGISKEEILEVFIQLAVYAGFPVAVNAVFLAKEVFDKRAQPSA